MELFLELVYKKYDLTENEVELLRNLLQKDMSVEQIAEKNNTAAVLTTSEISRVCKKLGVNVRTGCETSQLKQTAQKTIIQINASPSLKQKLCISILSKMCNLQDSEKQLITSLTSDNWLESVTKELLSCYNELYKKLLEISIQGSQETSVNDFVQSLSEKLLFIPYIQNTQLLEKLGRKYGLDTIEKEIIRYYILGH